MRSNRLCTLVNVFALLIYFILLFMSLSNRLCWNTQGVKARLEKYKKAENSGGKKWREEKIREKVGVCVWGGGNQDLQR